MLKSGSYGSGEGASWPEVGGIDIGGLKGSGACPDDASGAELEGTGGGGLGGGLEGTGGAGLEGTGVEGVDGVVSGVEVGPTGEGGDGVDCCV